MAQPAWQPLRTSEPEGEDDDDCEPGDWAGAEDDILLERLQPSTGNGYSRRVEARSISRQREGRFNFESIRGAKAAGAVALATATLLVMTLFAGRHFGSDLHAASANARDSVQKAGVQQQQQQQQVTTQKGQAAVNHEHAHHHHCCCCDDCDCDGGQAFCDSLTCPTGYVTRQGADRIECRGDACTLEADLALCCNKQETCAGYTCQQGWALKGDADHILCSGSTCGPEDNALCCVPAKTCADYQCPKGTALEPDAQSKVCAGDPCTEDECCDSPDKPTIQSTSFGFNMGGGFSTTKSSEVDESLECKFNCFGEGVDSIGVDLGEESKKDVAKCREACKSSDECEGILFSESLQQGGEGTCHGKKRVHLALCQPGGGFVTEIIKRAAVWGKCALIGDPHIIQWDRPPVLNLPMYDNYDAGDYALLTSEVLLIHARFGFSERFPTATSTKGVAVAGSAIKGKALVASYSETKKRFVVWWDGKEILQNKGDSVDDGNLVAKYDDMDPTEFHDKARHTIGEEADKLPSFTFEFKAVSLRIYMLLGPDNVNLVIEMKKLEVQMDGLCGDFDCDPDDEDAASLEHRKQAHALDWKESAFYLADGAFHEKEFVKGTPESLENCDKDLLEKGREKCGFNKGVSSSEANACLEDVCAAGTVDVAAMDVETVGAEEEIDAKSHA